MKRVLLCAVIFSCTAFDKTVTFTARQQGMIGNLAVAPYRQYYPDKIINAKVYQPYTYIGGESSSYQHGIGGTIRADAAFASHAYQSLGLYPTVAFWPLPPIPGYFNGFGRLIQSTNDINAIPETGWGDATIQLLHWTTLDIAGGKLSSRIILDFFGFFVGVGIAVIENAYVQWEKNNFKLLIGQYWNPNMVRWNTPNTVSNNLGAPFAAAAVNPQIRLEYTWGKVTGIFTAYTQFLFLSPGSYLGFLPQQFEILSFSDPEALSFSPQYLRWGVLPDINLGLRFDHKNTTVLVMFDFRRLLPQAFATTMDLPPFNFLDVTEYTLDESILSVISSVYFKHTHPKIITQGQLFYGSNSADLYQLGGYAIATSTITQATRSDQAVKTYTNTYCINGWVACEFPLFGGRVLPGFFIGYARQLGSRIPLTLFTDQGGNRFPIIYDIITGGPLTFTYQELGSLLRIGPRLWLHINENILLGAEIDFNRAVWGTPNEFAQPIIDQQVNYLVRPMVTMQFFF